MPTLPLSSDLQEETPGYLAKQVAKTVPQYSFKEAMEARYRLGDMNDTISNLADIISSHTLKQRGPTYSPQELKEYFPDSTVDIKYPTTIGEFTRIDKRKRELDKIARINEYSPQSAVNSTLKFGAEIAGGTSSLDLLLSMGVGAAAGTIAPIARFAGSSPKFFSLYSNLAENLLVEPGNIYAHKLNLESYDYMTDAPMNIIGGAFLGTGLELGVKKVANFAFDKFPEKSINQKIIDSEIETNNTMIQMSLEADKKPDFGLTESVNRSRANQLTEDLKSESLSDGSPVDISQREEIITKEQSKEFIERMASPDSHFLHDSDASLRVENTEAPMTSKINDVEIEVDKAYKIIDDYYADGQIKEADYKVLRNNLEDSKQRTKIIKVLSDCGKRK